MVEDSPFDVNEDMDDKPIQEETMTISIPKFPTIDLTKYGLVAVKNLGDTVVAWKIVPVEQLEDEAYKFTDETMKRNQ